MKSNLKAAALALMSLLLVVPIASVAQSNDGTFSPPDGASMAQVPELISLDFEDEIELRKVVLTHMDHPTVTLDLSGQKAFGHSFRVPVIAMGAGPYRIEWRGLGKDGQTRRGSFTFNVR